MTMTDLEVSSAKHFLREELEQALLVLSTISDNYNECAIEQEVCKRLQEQVEALEGEKNSLELEAKQERLKNDVSNAALLDLQEILKRLQEEAQQMKKDRIRLDQMLASSKEENVVLANLVEKLSCDYDELKQLFDRHNSPKDDKIQALRNTARALENENALLSKERENLEEDVAILRRKIAGFAATERSLVQCQSAREDLQNELNAKDQERAFFLERFERLESEKMNVLGQVNELESELELCRAALVRLEEEKASWQQERSNSDDLLDALREGKRSVELKLQTVMADNDGLSEQVTASELRALSLEDSLRYLEQERSSLAASANDLEQKLAEQTSLYESGLCEMQRELSLRLEEIDANRDGEMRQVKERYIKLFNEKAEELHATKDELKRCSEALTSSERTISDLQYREEELQRLLHRTQASLEDAFRDSEKQVKAEMGSMKTRTEELEKELEGVRGQCEELRESYRSSVDALGRRLYEISALLREYQEGKDKEEEWNGRTSKRKTKKKKKKLLDA